MSITNDKRVDEYLKNYTYMEQIDLFSFDSLESPGKKTFIENMDINEFTIPKYINEFWTAKQRQANSIHEISYRACFKPQLPRFFIKLVTGAEDVIYDPFSGRGTTGIEAGLLERNVILNDVNPLSKIMSHPRFFIPDLKELQERLNNIPMEEGAKADIDLSMFYHEKTEAEIVSLKQYLQLRKNSEEEDEIDRWIRMVATNRLTGHSKGFFSVYSLPPNQAVSPKSQIKINVKRGQEPDYRDIRIRIFNKSKSLMRSLTNKHRQTLRRIGTNVLFLCNDARKTPKIPNDSIQLTVTSPPFLNIVQYSKDNWLRCWFNSIDTQEIEKMITMSSKVEDWIEVMSDVFRELYRVTKPEGWVAFEVGEVRKGAIKLDEHIVPLGLKAGFRCEGIVINSQQFTKTSNIWGIDNMKGGTNTNRITLFYKQ